MAVNLRVSPTSTLAILRFAAVEGAMGSPCAGLAL